ncbi:MAG TPA: glycosyltransferase [Ignavibacteriales bacterium]|nr:glycosyltransferase [Ignavibacteriales bacterium]
MKLVIFGLTISSSWGNGHATIWRGLCHAMIRRGYDITFFERDVPYYASHRDLYEMAGMEIILYPDWDQVQSLAEKKLRDSDIGMVTSYCPDALRAGDLVLNSNCALKVFYDLDTPVTLKNLDQGQPVAYVGERGFEDYDLVLSYTGGIALEELKTKLKARKTAPLYGSADPETHKPVPAVDKFLCDLSYLGTYADDRQEALVKYFIRPAGILPDKRFIIGGSQYPEVFPWRDNIWYLAHIAPPEHPAFYSSSHFTLNITRGAMAEMGYCPSGRLFEAASCGVPIISDSWMGLDKFFRLGKEIITVRTSEDVVSALRMPEEERQRIIRAARERVFSEHTPQQRINELEKILDEYYNTANNRKEA